MFGYTNAYRDRRGTLVMAGGKNKGFHIQWSGSALNELRADGVETIYMIEHALNTGGKLTRLDLAIDLQNSRLTVQSIITHLEKGLGKLSVHKWAPIGTKSLGQTVYIGSKASLRFLRIYDKRAELARKNTPTDGEWVRVEVVLRDDYANGAAHAILEHGIQPVIAASVYAVADFPRLAAWVLMVDHLGMPCDIKRSIRGERQSQKWIIESVMATLKRELKDDKFAQLFYNELTRVE